MDPQQCEGRNIWVTGACGLIGSYITDVLRKCLPGSQIMPINRGAPDITDFDEVKKAFEAQNPALVIHCAAVSRSPACEEFPALARALNVDVTANLAALASQSAFVFFSSDQVFDGRNPPYNEDSRPNPLSVYARTKVDAELAVLKNPRHLVIRTSLNAGTSPTGDRGINEQMRIAWRAGKELPLFTDEFRCPIHARLTAEATCELALKGCTGIYHVAGAQRMSRYELGLLLARRCPELQPRIKAASLASYQGPPRPPDLTMDCSKADAVLETPLKGLEEWLSQHPEELF